MSGGESSGSCAFDTLFKMQVPHILEKIFLSLDYDSFKECMEVNSTWKALLKSESYLKKGKALFREEISEDVDQLFDASKLGRTDEVRSILSSGMVDVDTGGQSAYLVRAPLHLAAMNGHADVVKVLLGFGADPNINDFWGRGTPLVYAAAVGHKTVVQVLLDSGANPNLANNDGYTPLYEAAFRGNNEVTQVLLDSGANPNFANDCGDTPLNAAAFRGHIEVAQVLLGGGADPNRANKWGKTPLHSAATWGRKHVVTMLLDIGADPEIQDEDGRTPLKEAADRGNREVEQMLLLHIKSVGKDFVAGK